jgi:hypothetical protein
MSDDFYIGVLCALGELTTHRMADTPVYHDIVQACGEADLVRVARRNGDMTISGLSTSGYGKRKAALR